MTVSNASRILILYFSGTGNTAFVAKKLEQRLLSLDFSVVLKSIESIQTDRLDGFDLLVFGFPVYACDVPSHVRTYLDRLQPVVDLPAMVFCTKALVSGGALKRAGRLLSDKGYRIAGFEQFKLPGSDALAFVSKNSRTARSASETDFSNLPGLDRFARQIEDELDESASSYAVRTGFFGGLIGLLFRLAYPRLERKMKARLWADERCNLCKKCERICPVDNISVEQSVRFADRCMLCMRCIHHCPTEAIQIGKVTVDKFRWPGPDGTYDPMLE